MSLENGPLIDVLDDNGLRTGEVLSRIEIHRQGKIHRAVHLYLFDEQGNILLQRRSDMVDNYPGIWSISLVGHVDAGEGSTTALLRELKEELGLNPQDLTFEHLFSYRRDAQLSPQYNDHQINEVFVGFCTTNTKDIPFDPREVSEIKFVPFLEFTKMLSDPKSSLAPIYAEACANVIHYLSARLHALHPAWFFEAS